MGKIYRLYRDNIYGVMAALLFHIIVLTVLLVGRINGQIEFPEDDILIDFAAEEIKLPEPERRPELSQLPSAQKGATTNRASNELAREATNNPRDPFFDREYQKEVAAAKALSNDVNKNLAQKIPQIGDIAMPEANTEGMTKEEAMKAQFKGKSNIRYQLENRYHVRLPIPIYLAQGGGEVTVDIVVNRDGRVVSAVPRSNPTISDLTLLAYAQQAAEKTRFNADSAAPDKQRGTITYVFIPQ